MCVCVCVCVHVHACVRVGISIFELFHRSTCIFLRCPPDAPRSVCLPRAIARLIVDLCCEVQFYLQLYIITVKMIAII